MARAVSGNDLFQLEAKWNRKCLDGPDEIEVAVTIEAGKYRQPGPKPQRAVVWVVDVSGSMCSLDVPGKDEDGRETVISRIDGAKRDLCAWLANVAADKSAATHVCLVSFSTEAVLRFGFTIITEENLEDLQATVESLAPNGGTCAQPGLAKAFEQIDLLQESVRNQAARNTPSGKSKGSEPSSSFSDLNVYLFSDGEIFDVEATVSELESAKGNTKRFGVLPQPNFGFLPAVPTATMQTTFKLLAGACHGSVLSPGEYEFLGDLKYEADVPIEAQTRLNIQVPDGATAFVPLDSIRLSTKLAQTFKSSDSTSTLHQRSWTIPRIGVSKFRRFTVCFSLDANPNGKQRDVHVLDIVLATDRPRRGATDLRRSDECRVQILLDRVLDEPAAVNPDVKEIEDHEKVASTASEASKKVRSQINERVVEAVGDIRAEQERIEGETEEGKPLSWVFNVLVEAERRLRDTVRSKRDAEAVARFLDLVVEALESGKVSASLQEELPKVGATMRRSVARAWLKRLVTDPAKQFFQQGAGKGKGSGKDAGSEESTKRVSPGWVQEVGGAARYRPGHAKDKLVELIEDDVSISPAVKEEIAKFADGEADGTQSAPDPAESEAEDAHDEGLGGGEPT